jgi:RNA polymerase sigma-70 factor (ECF subfamily)
MESQGRGPGSAGDDDGAFVERCRKGDTGAFETLVERHQKRMLNTAYRMLGDYQDACDAVQEAFISAYRSIGSFRGDSRFSTWMTSIVLNHSRNRLAQRSVRACRECASLDEAAEKRDGRTPRELQSPDESSDERMERKMIEGKVQDCIDALDGDQRQVLVLRDIQGFEYNEISGMLKLPGGTVRSRLFRARLAMKDCLKGVMEAA